MFGKQLAKFLKDQGAEYTWVYKGVRICAAWDSHDRVLITWKVA